MVIMWHLPGLPLRKYFLNQSNILSISPLSCPRTNILSDKQEYGVLSLVKLAKSRSSIS